MIICSVLKVGVVVGVFTCLVFHAMETTQLVKPTDSFNKKFNSSNKAPQIIANLRNNNALLIADNTMLYALLNRQKATSSYWHTRAQDLYASNCVLANDLEKKKAKSKKKKKLIEEKDEVIVELTANYAKLAAEFNKLAEKSNKTEEDHKDTNKNLSYYS